MDTEEDLEEGLVVEEVLDSASEVLLLHGLTLVEVEGGYHGAGIQGYGELQ